MISLHSSGYFITGSDTDVGKTYVACELIRQLSQMGVPLAVRKPVESGCIRDESGGLIARDALTLQASGHHQEPIEHIVRYRLTAALAPDRAARLEGQRLHVSDLLAACAVSDDRQCLIVEGAGGFYSPIAENSLNADLAALLQLPVVLVIKDKVGAVNQALMTIQAVRNRDLPIAAIILNQVDASSDPNMDNLEDLTRHCNYPIFQCRYRQKLEQVFA